MSTQRPLFANNQRLVQFNEKISLCYASIIVRRNSQLSCLIQYKKARALGNLASIRLFHTKAYPICQIVIVNRQVKRKRQHSMRSAVVKPLTCRLLTQRLPKATTIATNYGKDVWSSEVRNLHQNNLNSQVVAFLPFRFLQRDFIF
jgi:hypothetical protein